MGKNAIRVLQITTGLQIGGVQTFLMSYSRELVSKQVIFDYVVQTEKPQNYDKEVRERGSKIYPVTPMTKSSFRFAQDIYRICKKHPEYTIVHSHLNFRNFLPLLAAKMAGVPVRISHSHNSYEAKSYVKLIERKVFQAGLPLFATDYWGCSNQAAKWLHGKYSVCEHGRVIYNAIDVSLYRFKEACRQSIRSKLGITKDEKLWMHSGTLSPIKNQIFILRLFAQYCQTDAHAKLVLCGDGPARAEIESEINCLGLNNSVFLPGMVSNVHEYLMGADLFVFPSLHEGLPLSAIEAQASGVPCVFSEAVPEEAVFTPNTIRCKDFEIDTWQQAIRSVCAVEFDREEAAELAAQAGYEIKVEAEKLAENYMEVNGRK